jgi:hypothetical protein
MNVEEQFKPYLCIALLQATLLQTNKNNAEFIILNSSGEYR